MLYLKSDIDSSGRVYGHLMKKFIPDRSDEYIDTYNTSLRRYPTLWQWLCYGYLLPGTEDRYNILVKERDICEIYRYRIFDPEYLVTEILKKDHDIMISIPSNIPWDKQAEELEKLYEDPRQQEALQKKYPHPNRFSEILPVLEGIKNIPDQLDILCDFLDDYPEYKRDIWKLRPLYQSWIDILVYPNELRRTGYKVPNIEKRYWQKGTKIDGLICKRFRRGMTISHFQKGGVYKDLRDKIALYQRTDSISYGQLENLLYGIYTIYERISNGTYTLIDLHL